MPKSDCYDVGKLVKVQTYAIGLFRGLPGVPSLRDSEAERLLLRRLGSGDVIWDSARLVPQHCAFRF